MEQSSNDRRNSVAMVKAAIFFLFLVGCFFIYNITPVGEYLDPQTLRDLAASNNASPVIFILLYGLGITMFMPASAFTAIGAMLFGLYWGLLFNFVGAMLGASLSFFIGRYLGRDFAESVSGKQLRKYDEKITKNGFKTTLYLRLIFFPFTPLNFGMGLTGVTFSQFFWGTFFGKIASGVVLTYFFASLADVWINGQLLDLLKPHTIFAILLFVFSFYLPKIAKKFIYAE